MWEGRCALAMYWRILKTCVCAHAHLCVFVSVSGDLAHFNLWQGEDVVKTIITVSLSLITAR